MTATFTATYSPEDNKLRLYADRRLDAETYARIKDVGFKWAPKQELFVAPRWTPDREDLCVELAGEIEPEFTTLAERAEAKAERLDALADKRQAQSSAFLRAADDLSQAFHMGQPILVGHHSERKARKTQERMHNAMDKSVKAAKSVQYWQWKAAGVESFANMKSSPRVRANRIKTLLAELRDLQRSVNHAQVCLSVWERAETEDQIRKLSRAHVNGNALVSWERAKELEDGEISPQDFRTRCIESAKRSINSPKRRRWIDHTLNRLAYERDLLGAVARYEGELSPVILQAFAREHGAMKPTAKAVPEGFSLESAVPLPLHIASEKAVTRSADEWRDLMQSVGYTVPEKKDAKPPILNFRAGELVAPNRFHAGETQTFRQIELTKAEYAKVWVDQRGTRTSVCGTYRFKICLDPTAPGAYFSRPWVAVFLTDSKEHPAPESFTAQANAA